AAIRATCQAALARHVSRSWLALVIALLSRLSRLADKLVESSQVFRCQVICFDEAHDQARRGAYKQPFDGVAQCLFSDLPPADGGGIEVGAVLESALDSLFSIENIEHRLDGGIRKVPFESLLNGLDIGGPGLPEDAHDFEFERRQSFPDRCHSRAPHGF